ncbi:MAG: hypothetical protein EZS28_042442, partial [Streblomastix strix]
MQHQHSFDDSTKTQNSISNSKTDIDQSSQCCTTAIALTDTPAGLSLLSLQFNFDQHRISLHSFAMSAIPPSASRLMPVIDENRVIKCLKGEEIKLLNRVHACDMNIVKSALSKNSDFLNQYFSQTGLSDDIDENNLDENRSSFAFGSQNSIVHHIGNSPNINYQSRLIAQRNSTNQLRKYITRQQFKDNTFIITFPNKLQHKHRIQTIGNDPDKSSEDGSKLSSTTGTETSDNTDNMRLVMDQDDLTDNSDTFVISRSSSISNNNNNNNNAFLVNETILNFHPFLMITSHGVTLFTSHLTILKFIFPIPFSQPPMCCLYSGGYETNTQKQLNQQNQSSTTEYKRSSRHGSQNNIRAIDKLFISSGNALTIIANGQTQHHFYPYKYFNELVMTNGANWFLPIPNKPISPIDPLYQQSSPSLQSQSSTTNQLQIKSQPLSQDLDNKSQLSVQLSLDQDIQSSQLQSSDGSSVKSEIDDVQLRIRSPLLFIISASNSSMTVDLSTGGFYDFPEKESEFKELGEGGVEDFQ